MTVWTNAREWKEPEFRYMLAFFAMNHIRRKGEIGFFFL